MNTKPRCHCRAIALLLLGLPLVLALHWRFKSQPAGKDTRAEYTISRADEPGHEGLSSAPVEEGSALQRLITGQPAYHEVHLLR